MKCLQCGAENEDSAKFCTACGVNLNQEKKSFWKHLFNWKYYIFPLLVGFIVELYYIRTNINLMSYIRITGTIMGILMAVQLDDKFLKKLGMFFAGGFATNVIAVLAFFSLTFAYDSFGNNTSEMMVKKILEKNKNLPKMMNEEVEMLKFTSDNSHSVKTNVKFTKYTKNDILSDYKSVNAFENDMLNSELKVSCPKKSVKKMLASGLTDWIVYYDKHNDLIGQIYLNTKKCQPYYK